LADLRAAREELAQGERLKAIGQVATFVAHEIKNPLASISILVRESEDRWDDPRFRAMLLGVVPEEVNRLSQQVDRILEYARPTPLTKVPVSVSELIESALTTLAAEIDESGVRVERSLDAETPRVLADGERLRQVFINLIRNGLDALAERNDGQIFVSVGRADDSLVEAMVEDNGPGFSGEVVGRAFEPFFTSKETGAGIGLALCRKLVREHGGEIRAGNRPSGGARLRILLPIEGT
jgi:signal transduction histidine kinase